MALVIAFLQYEMVELVLRELCPFLISVKDMNFFYHSVTFSKKYNKNSFFIYLKFLAIIIIY